MLFCDHLMAHIIKYKDKVKVEKISPQQAQSQLELLNAIAMITLKVRSKTLQVNEHYDKIFCPILCNLALEAWSWPCTFKS